jgi:ketosteroid isomerase-like protein
MEPNISEVVRAYFAAWPARDREGMERVLTDDFQFTSPLDNSLDRATFLERCWPRSEDIASLDLKRLIPDGYLAFVTYELTMKDGRSFRNSEAVTVRDGKVREVEVYFGWDVPHKAAPGGFVDELHIGGTTEETAKKD